MRSSPVNLRQEAQDRDGTLNAGRWGSPCGFPPGFYPGFRGTGFDERETRLNEPVLMLGDCLERMEEIPSASVDLVLTDLPYAVTNCTWDTPIDLPRLWTHYERVLRPSGAVVLTAVQPFTSALVMSNLKWFRYEWVWDKGTGTGFLSAKLQPMRVHETVLVFAPAGTVYNPQKWQGPRNHSRRASYKRSVKSIYFGAYHEPESDVSGMKYPRSIIDCPKHAAVESLHPTQKPTELLKYLILTYTNRGAVVLDSCFGSGSCGVAAADTRRNFIGIERDKAYFCQGAERIRQAYQTAELALDIDDEPPANTRQEAMQL